MWCFPDTSAQMHFNFEFSFKGAKLAPRIPLHAQDMFPSFNQGIYLNVNLIELISILNWMHAH